MDHRLSEIRLAIITHTCTPEKGPCINSLGQVVKKKNRSRMKPSKRKIVLVNNDRIFLVFRDLPVLPMKDELQGVLVWECEMIC